jgi:hypothetical protein
VVTSGTSNSFFSSMLSPSPLSTASEYVDYTRYQRKPPPG